MTHVPYSDVLLSIVAIVHSSLGSYITCEYEQKSLDVTPWGGGVSVYRTNSICRTFLWIRSLCIPSTFYEWNWTCCTDKDGEMLHFDLNLSMENSRIWRDTEDRPTCFWVVIDSNRHCMNRTLCVLHVTLKITVHGDITTYWSQMQTRFAKTIQDKTTEARTNTDLQFHAMKTTSLTSQDVYAELSASKQQPKDVSAENSASKQQPKDVSAENSASKQQPKDVSAENSASKQQSKDVSAENSASKQQPKDVSAENSASKQQSKDVSAENSASKHQPKDVSAENSASKQQSKDVSAENSASKQQPKEVSAETPKSEKPKDVSTENLPSEQQAQGRSKSRQLSKGMSLEPMSLFEVVSTKQQPKSVSTETSKSKQQLQAVSAGTTKSKQQPKSGPTVPKKISEDVSKSAMQPVVTMGNPCKSSSDCQLPKSVCYKGVCLCQPGLALEDGKCVKGCKKYDTTFTVYNGLAIKHHNNRKEARAVIKDCMKMCVSEGSFLCLTFEYKTTIGECRISETGYLDAVPKDRQRGKYYIMFGTRNCVNQ